MSFCISQVKNKVIYYDSKSEFTWSRLHQLRNLITPGLYKGLKIDDKFQYVSNIVYIMWWLILVSSQTMTYIYFVSKYFIIFHQQILFHCWYYIICQFWIPLYSYYKLHNYEYQNIGSLRFQFVRRLKPINPLTRVSLLLQCFKDWYRFDDLNICLAICLSVCHILLFANIIVRLAM